MKRRNFTILTLLLATKTQIVNDFPILQCRVGPVLKSVFWNDNTHLSEIFSFNISESQTYLKYYYCQANIPILSPGYVIDNTQLDFQILHLF